MEATPTSEVTFYRDPQVHVTQSRFITGSKTYAMRNISSVYLFEIEKNRGLPVVIGIVGLLMLLSNDLRAVGCVIAAAGFGWLFLIKNEYAVRISTNSGEANSLISKNRAYIERIVNALNDAIVHRG